MSVQLETVDDQPPRDGADIEALRSASPSEGDGGGPAGLKGVGSSSSSIAAEQLEDFLYIDIEESAKKDSDAGDLGAEGQCERTNNVPAMPSCHRHLFSLRLM